LPVYCLLYCANIEIRVHCNRSSLATLSLRPLDLGKLSVSKVWHTTCTSILSCATTMTEHQPVVFPWGLLVLFELLYNVSCFPTKIPFIGEWILGPSMLAIAVHLWRQPYQLVGSSSLAYAIGFRLSFQSFSMVNLIYINPTIPNLLRRKKDGTAPPSMFST
jgi:hypothetical protein